MKVGKIDSYYPVRIGSNATALTVQEKKSEKHLSDAEKLDAIVNFLVERKESLTPPPKTKGFYFVINRREDQNNYKKIGAFETPMMKVFNKTYKLGSKAEPGLLVDITA